MVKLQELINKASSKINEALDTWRVEEGLLLLVDNAVNLIDNYPYLRFLRDRLKEAQEGAKIKVISPRRNIDSNISAFYVSTSDTMYLYKEQVINYYNISKKLRKRVPISYEEEFNYNFMEETIIHETVHRYRDIKGFSDEIEGDKSVNISKYYVEEIIASAIANAILNNEKYTMNSCIALKEACIGDRIRKNNKGIDRCPYYYGNLLGLDLILLDNKEQMENAMYNLINVRNKKDFISLFKQNRTMAKGLIKEMELIDNLEDNNFIPEVLYE